MHKNLLPFCGVPLVRHAMQKLLKVGLFDKVVLSTDCELIARTCMDLDGIHILRRSADISQDSTPSVPVFQDIIRNHPCDIHLNYNCNFPICDNKVFEEAISLAREKGESLSDPYAVWAQTEQCLNNYGDPFKITAPIFKSKLIHPIDIHSFSELIEVHKDSQGEFLW